MFSVYFNSELMFLVFFGDSVVLLFKQFSWFVDDFSTVQDVVPLHKVLMR